MKSMSTSKWLERICAAAVALCLVITLALFFARAMGAEPVKTVIGYENRLFDTSKVHTIDIVMDDWDGFLQTCENEEYAMCAVVIDGERSRNVAIRAKGNTSLRNVASLGSSRYSFKIEFDHYDSGKSYHGLDKLSLNNLIQDNTLMKDYLTYQMMGAFGVDSPLCSYAYLTVNGEDWGLYLAVEGVEDSFLRRTENGTGELYKPDSMDMGGGRGNGREFDFGDFDFDVSDIQFPDGQGGDTPALPENADSQPGTFDPSRQGQSPPQMGGMGEPPAFDGETGGTFPEGQTPPQMGDMGGVPSFGGGGMPQMDGMGGGMNGASDVKLQYIDDDPNSYANIFDNAKTGVSDADKARLIASLQSLSAFEDLENVLDIDEVLRYFVVHNFVVNGDSYTGNMIHNYYLHENDGRLSMIPWDYNLAFGTFQGGSASTSVNDAIDDVLSDRPMQAWIFSDAAYTQQYHELFAEFLNTVDINALIDNAYTLIAPYAEKDPTKFCTYEEFETGVAALKEFCTLRTESVRGQLSGAIPSTSEAQQADSAALVDTGTLNLSDLGTMNSGQGGFGGMPGNGGNFGGRFNGQANGAQDDTGSAPGSASGSTDTPPDGTAGGGSSDTTQPPDADSSDSAVNSDGQTTPQGSLREMQGGQRRPDMSGAPETSGTSSLLLMGVSVLVLAGGLVFAFVFKR